MTYRLLRPDEWTRLDAFISKDMIPSPLISQVAIAEAANGEVAAFLVLQLAAHVEPLYISPRYSHAVRFNKLFHLLVDKAACRIFYAFSASKLVSRMLDFVGMKRSPYSIWTYQK